ncbi:MAG TPA: LuxR C-terminal-related transcriptional regulator [Gaiellaceae bacterium]|nr:LuxR C-terminal-related transcriptional regulator [Gaiellaceae bacterium]
MNAESELERARNAYASRAWGDAYEALAAADKELALSAADLELLARSAYMLGLDEDYVDGLERAHSAHLATGDVRPAVRCAFWVGHSMLFRGQLSPALGWFARGNRLLEPEDSDCAERGYLLIPVVLEHTSRGEFEAAHATATETAETGERFGDQDLAAMGVMEQGHALVRQGKAEEGLRLVDESMAAVSAGQLSPIVAGIVYCNTIAFCRDVYEVRRAREWTAALTRWCEEQPEMVAHNGLCLVHRAELMTIGGAWTAALEELRQVGERFRRGVLNQRALGHAAYREGEVHRFQGAFREAETAYKESARFGREPLPGLALLRLAQGKGEAAAAAIRRALDETVLPLRRAALLPAWVEIALAVGDLEGARASCGELEEIAARQPSELLAATAAHARGALALAEGNADGAVAALRSAWRMWQELEAPYEAARSRVLLGLACAELGDDDTKAVELEAARDAFEKLGAAPEIARVDELAGRTPPDAHGLSAREVQVLRLVASGMSNRDIATELVISERTVARHVQNIFAKLRLCSRAAASVFASEHGLL